jgi:XapX domain-containing protein
VKPVLGIVIGFALGFGCRYLGIPSPAPPVLFGALLVMAMTLGHAIADHLLATRAGRPEQPAAPNQAAPTTPEHKPHIAA